MKKLLLILSAVILCISCGGANVASEKYSGGTLKRIQDAGVIKIGVSLNGPPIGFRDDKGNPMGYDVDFAQKLADTLGVKVEFVDVNGETRISTITSGRVDVVFANMTANLTRAQAIDFSIPYLKAGIKMMVKAGMENKYKTVDDLNSPGMKIAVGRGTTGEELAKQFAPKAEIIFVPDFTDQLLLLKQGKADAVFEDSSLIDFAVGQAPKELAAPPKLYTSDPIAIGVAKGDLEFVRYLDMFVSWQISSGWQKELYKKWWGQEPTAELIAIW